MLRINLAELSGIFEAYQNCLASKNTEWKEKHEERIEKILENLPHGSGIDAGCKFSWEDSTSEKLVFTFGFHHMDTNGYYDGWTDHKLTIRPSFLFEYDMKISGRNRNQIKEYLYDLFGAIFYVDSHYQIKQKEAS